MSISSTLTLNSWGMVPTQEAKLGLLTPIIPPIHVLAHLGHAINMWPSDEVLLPARLGGVTP